MVVCIAIAMTPSNNGFESSVSSFGEEKSQNKERSGPRRLSKWLWIVMGVLLMLLFVGLAVGLSIGQRNQQPAEVGKDIVVDLGYSRYRGKEFEDGTSQWLGMRYAAPPVGNLRFAAPQNPLPTQDIQSASEHGPRCLGTYAEVSDKPISSSTSEDCLFVDLYAPSNIPKDSKLPVYLFIQGGGFNDNSNSNYDGRYLVKASNMGIIVLNFNYRVGPYGFLASAEVQKSGSLNNGLKDQRQVLHWIQAHISKFGGDPRHVVLGGASAGAASVTLQLVAYGGRDDGLFHATAAESQSFGAIRTVAESQYQYDQLTARTNCTASHTGNTDTLACLRGLDIAVLQMYNIKTEFPGAKRLPLFAYNPTLDFDFVQDYTLRLFEKGHFVRVPAIYGDVTDEGTVFVPRETATKVDYENFIQAQYPVISQTHLDELAKLYPVGQQFPDAGEYWHCTSTAYGELRYVCPGIYLSNMYSLYNVKGNYNYRYNIASQSDLAHGIGVPHVAELNAIWSHRDSPPAPSSDFNADIPLLLQKYWTSFIKTYDPNTFRVPGSPKWEEWTANGQGKGKMTRLLVLDGVNASTTEIVNEQQTKRCNVISPWGVNLKQ